jgi:hypothetical protein
MVQIDVVIYNENLCGHMRLLSKAIPRKSPKGEKEKNTTHKVMIS